MKLWIDDIRPAPSDEWVVARTINQAIKAMTKFDFEEISLDHDISHQVVVGKLSRPFPCDECFCAVAYYLGNVFQFKEFGVPKIVVHSASPVGSKEIQAILRDHGVKSTINSMGATNRFEMEV